MISLFLLENSRILLQTVEYYLEDQSVPYSNWIALIEWLKAAEPAFTQMSTHTDQENIGIMNHTSLNGGKWLKWSSPS